MKRCPECRLDYYDDSLLYCLEDGAALVQGSVADEPETVMLSGDSTPNGDVTAVLNAGETTARSRPVTVRLPTFLSWERLPWMLVCVLLIVIAGGMAFWARTSRLQRQTEPTRAVFQIQPPPRLAGYGQIAISPDGKTIAVNGNVDGTSKIWLRKIDSLEGRPLAGTNGVQAFPFWSPDGRSIGFFIIGKLRRIDLADGTVRDLLDPPGGAGGGGGTWNRDGTILINGGSSGILRVNATTGATETVPGYEPKPDELHRWPKFLPDGKHFVFLKTNSDRTKSEVYVGSIDGPQPKLLFAADSDATFSPGTNGRGGYLLFARGGALLGQGFDPNTLELVGDPFRVADSVRINSNQRALVAVSENGTLVYDPSTDEEEARQLSWYDRSGKMIKTVGQPGVISRFRLSPDEKSLLTLRRTPGSAMNDLIVGDIERGASSKLLTIPGTNESIWSPDGKSVVWNQTVEGKSRLVMKPASGAGEAEVLLESPDSITPTGWSPDGKFILYTLFEDKNGFDIWVLPLEGDRKPYPYVQTPFGESNAVFSPDGKYVAFNSREFGSDQIYIQDFPASSPKIPVSTNGGTYPYWPRKGHELFYIQGDGKMMSAEIKPGSPPGIGSLQPLFDLTAVRTPRIQDYNVSNDGQRFLFISRGADAVSPPLIVILNWSAGLNR